MNQRSIQVIYHSMIHRNPLRIAVGLLALLVLTSQLPAGDWPQWRGPNCVGISEDVAPLPAEFSLEKNLAWSAELGDAISSPVVVGGRVFSTAMLGEKPGHTFVVYCHDTASGDELWKREMPVGDQPLANVHDANSYASSTPAADDKHVYVYFTRFGLLALDAANGETTWECPLPEPYFVFDWGPGMSPVLHNGRLFFCQDDDLSPALYCINSANGEIIWKDDRSDMACSYSHPVVCDTENGPELVVAGTGSILGYDYNTGKRKWAAELFCRNIKTTPVVVDGIIYVSVESKGITYQWRAVADANDDGKITREEIENNKYRLNKTPLPDLFWKKFERGDKNNDGVLEGEEIDLAFLDPSNQGGVLAKDVTERLGDENKTQTDAEDVFQKQSEASIQAVRPGGQGDVSKTHVLWRHKTRATDHIVSPLILDGRMHLIKSGGISSCYDVKDGKKIWFRKRIKNSHRHLASPVYGDGKIYVTGENGTIIVLKNGPELEVLAKNELGEVSASTPAIVDGRIFVRTRKGLYCFALAN